MSIKQATEAGQGFAQQTFFDGTTTCTVTRGAATQTLDTDEGVYVTTPAETVYTGPCRVKPRDNTDRVVEAGGQAVSLFPFVVSVPISDVRFEVDDVVTVTASVLDPAMVGLVLRVKQIATGSHLTARRLGAEVDAG